VLKNIILSFLSLTIIFSIPLTLHAQDTLFHVDEPITGKVLKEADHRSPYFTNYILQDIAVGEMQDISDVNIRLETSRQLILYRLTDSTYRLVQILSDLQVNPLIYKSGNISGLLYPSIAHFTYVLSDSSGLDVRKVLLKHLITQGTPSVSYFEFTLFEPAIITGSNLIESEWIYIEEDYAVFREGLLKINDLHAAIYFLEELLEPVSLEFPDELPFMDQYIGYLELERIIRIIDEKDFDKLEGIEPGLMNQYLVQIDLAKRYLRRLETFVDQQLLMGNFPTLQEVEQGAGKWVDRMDGYFLRGINIDHQYTHFYSMLIVRDLLPEVITHERARLDSLHQLHRNTYYTDLIFEPLINAMYYRFLEKSEDYLSKDDFQKAKTFLDKALLLCNMASLSDGCAEGISLSDSVGDGFAGAYAGIIRKALDKNNIRIAEEYLLEMYEKSLVFNNDTLVNMLRDDLRRHLIIESAGHMASGEYRKSLEELAKAEKYNHQPDQDSLNDLPGYSRMDLYDSISATGFNQIEQLVADGDLFNADLLLDYPDSLLKDVTIQEIEVFLMRSRYKYYQDRGDNYLKIGAYSTALRGYLFVYELKLKNGVYDTSLLEKITNLATPLAIDRLNRVDSCNALLDFQCALNVLDEALHIMIAYHLLADPYVDSIYQAKVALIESRECLYKEKDLDGMMQQAYRFMDDQLYQSALKVVNEILSEVEGLERCAIKFDSVIIVREDLLVVNEYLGMIDSLNNIGDHGSYVNYALALDTYYDDHPQELATFDHQFTLQLVIKEGNYGLLAELLTHYMETGNNRRALEALWAMRDAGLESRDLRDQQDELGRQFADADFRAKTGKNRHILLNEYTRNYEWFGAFRKGYLERWEDLEGE